VTKFLLLGTHKQHSQVFAIVSAICILHFVEERWVIDLRSAQPL